MTAVGNSFVSCCDNCRDVVPATSRMIAIANATLLLIGVFMAPYALLLDLCIARTLFELQSNPMIGKLPLAAAPNFDAVTVDIRSLIRIHST